MPLVRRREPFDDRGRLFELKLDGFRAVAYMERGQARLVSRNGNAFKSFATLTEAVAKSVKATTAILDGEVVCLDGETGHPVFNQFLFRRAEPFFYAFDLLWLDGHDLRDLPLIERKRRLRRVIPRVGGVRYVTHVARRGIDLFRVACDLDLEGIVAKRRDGIYDPKATTWLKMNVNYSQARDR